jgi:hypothetical protein
MHGSDGSGSVRWFPEDGFLLTPHPIFVKKKEREDTHTHMMREKKIDRQERNG